MYACNQLMLKQVLFLARHHDLLCPLTLFNRASVKSCPSQVMCTRVTVAITCIGVGAVITVGSQGCVFTKTQDAV